MVVVLIALAATKTIITINKIRNKENPSQQRIIQQLIILIRVKQQQLIPINLVKITTLITTTAPYSHCNKSTRHNIQID